MGNEEYQPFKEKSGLFCSDSGREEGLGARLVYRDGLVGLKFTTNGPPNTQADLAARS